MVGKADQNRLRPGWLHPFLGVSGASLVLVTLFAWVGLSTGLLNTP